MAAEAVIGAALQLLFDKLIATAGKEISLMRGLKKEVASLKESLEMVNAFLHDASTRQVEEQSVKLWLQNLEDLAYEADDILDDINYEALRRKVEIRNQMKRKVRFYFSFNNPLVFRLKMAHRIKDLNLKLEKAKSDASSLHLDKIFANNATSLPQVTETNSVTRDPIVLGRENDVSKVTSLLVQLSEEVLSVIPITGMGGLGKTTLARLIFKDPQIVERFKQRIWVCVSENFESTVLFKRILEQIDVVREDSQEAILRKLQEKLKEGNYLLVLDDLWNNESSKWEEFRNSLLGINSNKGNFCLVTTRSTEVASIVKTMDLQYLLKELSPHDCWSLIKAKAFCGDEVPEDLEIVGKKIASNCGGVPLAANIAGATLKGKGIDDWTSFLQGGFSDLKVGENMVLQVLKVSFDRLQSPVLKKCFAYCSIFCKDAELEKQLLIQLWMAEGFLVENDMEIVGNRVYDLLLQNCFLQEAEKDEYGNIMKAKMHDLVHDLACSVSKVESINVKNCTIDKSYPRRLRYLAIESLDDEEAFKLMRERAVYLRTLFLGGDKLSDGVFKDIKNLHVLVLQGSNIKELTNSIGKLINLRLLDVSSTRIKAFPKDICKLFNLQTLRAIYCFNLERLPERLQQLVSLRHLVFNKYKYFEMPLRIGKLTSLRTLIIFNVGHENGRRIEELGSLKNLKGELEICHLERVNNKEEASRASLIEKPNIYKLKFVWIYSSGSGSNTCQNNDEEVLEGLQPHPNLKSLSIMGFKGDHFPPWIMSSIVGAASSLDKLTEIQLINCRRCEKVPTLGHLPLLKILELHGLESVRSLGYSFYYPHGTSESTSSERSRQQTPPFRALQSFKLKNMENLVEWIEAPRTMSADELRADRAFHSLEELVIEKCPNITVVPNHDFPALQTLKITGVQNGSWLIGMISGSNASSLTTLEIVGVAGVSRVSCNARRLEQLFINGGRDLQSIQFSIEGGLTSSSSLKYFVVSYCEALTDVMLGDSLDYTSLESFAIYNCRNVSVSSLEDFGRMPHLRFLGVCGCPKLRRLLVWGTNCLRHLTTLRLGPLSSEEEEEEDTSLSRFCEMLQGIHELQSLRDLTLHGQMHWDSLPDQIQHLANLTKLLLFDFGSVEALPEWLGNFSSLKWLWISNFKSLRKLPSKEAMQRLTKLECLDISQCPLLKEIKNPESDVYHSEWPKISDIRIVKVFSRE